MSVLRSGTGTRLYYLVSFLFLLLPDLGRHSVGSVLSDGRWERADPNGHRLRHRPSSGASAQSPGGQSSGTERHRTGG